MGEGRCPEEWQGHGLHDRAREGVSGVRQRYMEISLQIVRASFCVYIRYVVHLQKMRVVPPCKQLNDSTTERAHRWSARNSFALYASLLLRGPKLVACSSVEYFLFGAAVACEINILR